ncbi:MAG: C-type lectin domain-containing protein [Verrucomicrobia bacterium]|nr:C-type lectin domain-containing protein [Verrucomicrobiota bacterium]
MRSEVLYGPITNAANGHVYFLLSRTNWHAAEAEAVSLGGHLATIDHAAENAWVYQTFAAPNAFQLWLGLTDAAREGVFESCISRPALGQSHSVEIQAREATGWGLTVELGKRHQDLNA